jgi:Ti-type conjugative transfer relaxase TraA
MAAYHFSVKIHSRAKGASAVRAAAYRAAERLKDERLQKNEDYSRKADVIEAAILAPEGAPSWCQDREALWNEAEAREKRKDAQVAQEVELNLPREFSDEENWRLVVDFAKATFVAQGRVCDIAFHKPDAGDGAAHPHAHILMPTRKLEGGRFGGKHPDVSWTNFFSKDGRTTQWRAEWCAFASARAAELGISLGADWDHRSYVERDVDVEPQPKIGGAGRRIAGEEGTSERVEEYLEAMRRNGERLLADPNIALEALTRVQSTFTERDLARWVHSHSADDQFAGVFEAAKARAVPVGVDERGQERFSTADTIALERKMIETAETLRHRRSHEVPVPALPELTRSGLSDEQAHAVQHLLESANLRCLVGYAGTGKSTMLREVAERYAAAGYRVRGAALSGIAAENLEQGSGIEARTLAGWDYAWREGRAAIGSRDVFVIDEAGMVGSRQLAPVLEQARAAGAKVILVGDPEQLQAIEAGAAFRVIAERAGVAELTTVRRQQVDWQRTATKEFATGLTDAALKRYEAAGAVRGYDGQAAALEAVIAAWKADRGRAPSETQIILAHRRADARALNDAAREALKASGELGAEREFETSRGTRAFGEGDRLLFLRNERQLGVKNGTLATVEGFQGTIIKVRTDDGRAIRIDTGAYADFDHGYAVTVHKAQGVTVDRAHVLATAGFDRHLAYVACSRHRHGLTVTYDKTEFATPEVFRRTLSRDRSKDTTQDYSETFASVRDLDRQDSGTTRKSAGERLQGYIDRRIVAPRPGRGKIFESRENSAPERSPNTPSKPGPQFER